MSVALLTINAQSASMIFEITPPFLTRLRTLPTFELQRKGVLVSVLSDAVVIATLMVTFSVSLILSVLYPDT